MRANWVLHLAVVFSASCAREAAQPPSPLGPAVSYLVIGGFAAHGTQLEISTLGQATGWSLVETRQLIGQRQLSRAELEELDRLLEPFSGYEDSYGVFTEVTSSITMEVGHHEKTVVVYSPGEVVTPPGWEVLEAKLLEILDSL